MLYNPGLERPPFAGSPAKPARRRAATPRRAAVRVALWLATIAVLLALTLVAAIAFVISRAIDLPFVRDRVATAIEDALGAGYAASVGGATLKIDPVLGVVLAIAAVSVRDAAGQEVLTVPSTMLAIEPAALFTPRAVVRSIEIDGLWATLRRDRGKVVLGNAATPLDITALTPGAIQPPAPAGFELLSDPLEAIDRSLAEVLALATSSGFTNIDLYGAEIDLWRTGHDTPQHFARADLRFAAAPADGRLTAALSASGYSGRWAVTADRVTNSLTGGRTLSLVVSQLTMADFFGNTAVATDIPFYGRATVKLSASGEVESASARLDLAAGSFAFGPRVARIELDEAAILLRWDVAADTIIVEPSLLDFGPSRAVVSGFVRTDPSAGPRNFAFDFESRDAILAPRDSPAAPLAVDRIRLAGSADLDARLVTFDRALIATGQGSLAAAGSIGFERAGPPSIAMVATLTEMPVAAFKQLWPAGFQDAARRWVMSEVTAGIITSGRLEAEIPAGALTAALTPDMLRLELQLDDVTVRTMPGLPDMIRARGVFVLSGSTLGVDVERAQIVAPTGGIVEVTGVAFAIADITAPVPVAQLEATAMGAAAAFAALADAEPIGALDPLGLAPTAVEGEGTARLSATAPMIESLTFNDIEWRIILNLTGLGSRAPVAGRLVRDGDIALEVTMNAVEATGTAVVDGLVTNVDLTIPLVPDVDGRQHFRIVLDEEARRRLGFHLEGILGGTVLASVTDLAPRGAGQHYDLDLGPARVTIAAIGWAKGSGVAATMSFDLVETPGGYRVRDLRLVGEGFGFVGEAELDRDYGIVRATIRDVALRPSDRVDVALERTAGNWTVTVTGEAFDVRDLIAEGLANFDTLDGPGEARDLVVTGRIGALIGFGGEVIRDASFAFTSVGSSPQRIEIAGTLGGRPISGVYRRPAGAGSLDVYIGDAGSFLRFLDFYPRAQGGVLRVTGQEYTDGALRGRMEIANFALVDEPSLSRLMAATAAEGRAGRLPFEVLSFDYVLEGPRITIAEALLRGGDMGATGAGWVDVATGRFSLSGTYIPAYSFNNMFGRIPILGLALGGGHREGLIGVTFRISGPFDAPLMEINPLSAIAPGIFRKIFQFQ